MEDCEERTPKGVSTVYWLTMLTSKIIAHALKELKDQENSCFNILSCFNSTRLRCNIVKFLLKFCTSDHHTIHDHWYR